MRNRLGILCGWVALFAALLAVMFGFQAWDAWGTYRNMSTGLLSSAPAVVTQAPDRVSPARIRVDPPDGEPFTAILLGGNSRSALLVGMPMTVEYPPDHSVVVEAGVPLSNRAAWLQTLGAGLCVAVLAVAVAVGLPRWRPARP